MREIEIKVLLKDKDLAIAALKKADIALGKPKKQHDVVYCLPGDRERAGESGVNWLRIRTQNDSEVFFTLKQSVSGSLDSIEHETTIASASEMDASLRLMGYEIFSDLTKYRQTAHVGKIELCLDEVPPLGSFIELEKLIDGPSDVVAVERELFAVLDSLGIQYDKRITIGYDELMNDYLEAGE